MLKINNTVFTWRTEAGRVVSVAPADISAASWIRIYGKVFQLKLQLNIGNSIKFDGFRESVRIFLTFAIVCLFRIRILMYWKHFWKRLSKLSSLQYHSPLKDLIGANMKCKVIFLFRNSHLRITLQPRACIIFHHWRQTSLWFASLWSFKCSDATHKQERSSSWVPTG